MTQPCLKCESLMPKNIYNRICQLCTKRNKKQCAHIDTQMLDAGYGRAIPKKKTLE